MYDFDNEQLNKIKLHPSYSVIKVFLLEIQAFVDTLPVVFLWKGGSAGLFPPTSIGTGWQSLPGLDIWVKLHDLLGNSLMRRKTGNIT